MGYLLPKISVPDGKLSVFYRFGVASRASDGDNLIKAFQDCLSAQYGFNDNKIYKWSIEKVLVKKGEEFTEKNLRSIRPGIGVAPKYLDEILGKKSTQDIERGTPMNLDLVEK